MINLSYEEKVKKSYITEFAKNDQFAMHDISSYECN